MNAFTIKHPDGRKVIIPEGDLGVQMRSIYKQILHEDRGEGGDTVIEMECVAQKVRELGWRVQP